MNCLFRCHQCSYEEWRPEGQDPWLCVVCGYMMWTVVADDGPVAGPDVVSFVVDSDDLEEEENR